MPLKVPVEVHGDQALVVFVARVGERAEGGDAGIVDEHVDGSEFRFGALEEVGDCLWVGDIGAERQRPAAGRRDGRNHLFGLGGICRIIDDGLEAIGCEPPGDRRTDAPGCAGDDGGLGLV